MGGAEEEKRQTVRYVLARGGGEVQRTRPRSSPISHPPTPLPSSPLPPPPIHGNIAKVASSATRHQGEKNAFLVGTTVFFLLS